MKIPDLDEGGGDQSLTGSISMVGRWVGMGMKTDEERIASQGHSGRVGQGCAIMAKSAPAAPPPASGPSRDQRRHEDRAQAHGRQRVEMTPAR